MEAGVYTGIPACESTSTTHIPRGPKIESQILCGQERDHTTRPSPIADEEAKCSGDHHVPEAVVLRLCLLPGSFSCASLSPQTQAPFHQEVISRFNKLGDFVNLVPFEYPMTEIYERKKKKQKQSIGTQKQNKTVKNFFITWSRLILFPSILAVFTSLVIRKRGYIKVTWGCHYY